MTERARDIHVIVNFYSIIVWLCSFHETVQILSNGQKRLGIMNFNQNIRVKFDITMIFLLLY